MPTYDYRCPNGHDFEHFFRKISDATSELACPTCAAVATRRMSRGAGLVFKGSGFYLTDYGKNAHRKSGSEGAGDSSKGDGSGDSKPASAESGKAEGGSGSAKSGDSGSAAPKSEPSKTTETKPSSTKSKGGDSQ